MALGALIAAYQEDDHGALRALLPLAGRTLVEYQARCASAAGAASVVVMVERIPTELQAAFDRLRGEGLAIVAVSDGSEAASRFEAGAPILLVGDGIVPPLDLLTQIADEGEAIIVTVADDPAHSMFERIDAGARWAGVAVIDGQTLRSTAAMLGDWDLQSTLLRRAVQEGALRVPAAAGPGEPLLAERPEQVSAFERSLVALSRGERGDWASRYVLAPVEDFATEKLMPAPVTPGLLVWSAVGLSVGAGIAFTRGWLWPALAMLLIAAPLDLIARRLAFLRLQPLPDRLLGPRLLWPAAGLALAGLGWWLSRHGAGWGAMLAAVTAAAFAEAARIERGREPVPGGIWLLSRRNAILAALPFALFGAWTSFLVALALYAAVSFFLVQHCRHFPLSKPAD